MKNQSYDAAELILSKYQSLPSLNANHLDKDGYTALHHAARRPTKPNILDSLLQLPGIDPNINDPTGQSPLAIYLAQPGASPRIVEAFLKAGARDTSSSGDSLLHLAVNSANSVELLKKIMELSGDVNTVNGKGMTPLHLAVAAKDFETVRLLVENGAREDIPNYMKETPHSLSLKMCAQADAEEVTAQIFQYLLSVSQLKDFLRGTGCPPHKFIQQRVFLDVLKIDCVQRLSWLSPELKEVIIDKLKSNTPSSSPEFSLSAYSGTHSGAGTETPPQAITLAAFEGKVDPSFFLDPERIDCGGCIGAGGGSTVFLGTYHPLGGKQKAVALKKLDRGTPRIKDVAEEVGLLSKLHSKYLVGFDGIYVEHSILVVCLEYCPAGDLARVLKELQGRLTPVQCGHWLLDMTAGIKYLHQHGFVHRDFKSRNCLVTVDGSLKVTDFGLSRLSTADSLREARGTPGYWPPEIFQDMPYTPASDVYSLGIVMWEVLNTLSSCVWSQPYSEYAPNARIPAYESIRLMVLGNRPTLMGAGPFHDLYSRMVDGAPENRPTANSAYQELVSITGLTSHPNEGE